MKKIGILATLLFMVCSNIASQSTDRFIRIVGNASYEFEADAARAEFNLREIIGNEMKNIEAVSFDDVYTMFLHKLDSLNFNVKNLRRTDINLKKYNSGVSKTYELYIDSVSDVDKLPILKSVGVNLNSIKYVYDNVDPAIQENLMMLAIEDATRKASNICDKINMKLGKVLNIEDSSSGCCGDIKDSKESRTKKKYGLYITFELKD